MGLPKFEIGHFELDPEMEDYEEPTFFKDIIEDDYLMHESPGKTDGENDYHTTLGGEEDQ